MFPTLASELIKQLQVLIDKHGDLPVAAQGGDYYTSRVSCKLEPYYYDGGYLIPCDPPGYACNHWAESRRIVGTEIPNKFIRIRAGYPSDENDTINGSKIKSTLEEGVEIKSTPQEDININSYLALVKEFNPKLIRSIEQKEATQRMIDKLIDKSEVLNEGQQDYLDLLESLVYHYESYILLSNSDRDMFLEMLENPPELSEEVKLKWKQTFNKE